MNRVADRADKESCLAADDRQPVGKQGDMRTKSWVLLSAVLVAAGTAASACSSGPAHGSGGSGSEAGACQEADCGSAGQSGESSTIGSGGEAGAHGDPAPAACVPQGKTDLPDDSFTDSNCDGIDGDKTAAIFVSPTGDDKASGKFGAPVKSLVTAVALAASSGKAVYACNADYAENVVIDTKAVSIFGGYDCADWSRGNARATVKPASGVALTVRNSNGVTVDRMVFEAASATEPGSSSIAAQIVASDHVTLSHLELQAGDGAPGLAGAQVSAVTKRAQAGANGAAGDYCNNTIAGSHCTAKASSGGDGPATTCGGATVYGGSGGAAAPYPSGKPVLGYAGAPGRKRYGADGLAGVPGDAGVAASVGFGTVTETGYIASNSGTDGANGGIGQSGGGGNGGYSCHYEPFPSDAVADCIAGVGEDTYYYGSGGGQGGYGGCAGLGGHAGGAGGASIALLSINSTIVLSWSSLSTGNGGAGGVPSSGVKGQPGGLGGKAGKPSIYASGTYATLTAGEDGGSGGDGGPGGAGGPGGGGPSVTIVALGAAPTTKAVTFTPGAGGTGAPGLAGQDGASGESKEVEVIASPSLDGGVDSSAGASGI